MTDASRKARSTPMLRTMLSWFEHPAIRDELVKLVRYALVGLCNTAVGYSLILCGMALGLAPEPANAIGFACGLSTSFFLNSRWAFGRKTTGFRLPLGFLSAFAACYGLNLLVLAIALDAKLPPAFAQALAILSYQISFFVLLRVAVFGELPGFAMTHVRGMSVRDRVRVLLHVALSAAAAAPFLIGQGAAAMVDLANVIGRIGVGLRLYDDPQGSAFYTQSFKVIPNMAVDVWGLSVGRLLGPEIAVNLFVALSIALFYAAVQRLRIAMHGRSSVAIGALSVFIIYGLALRWGFINFVFASGLTILAVAALERDARQTSTVFPISQTVLLGLIYLSSLLPAFLYFVYAGVRLCPAAVTAVNRRDRAALLSLALRHGPSVLLVGALFTLGTTAPPWQQGTDWVLEFKLFALREMLWFVSEPFEVSLGVVTLSAGIILAWAAAMRFNRPQIAPLLALCVVYLVMPFSLKGVAFADTRLPCLIGGLIVGIVRFGITPPSRIWIVRTAVSILIAAAFLKPLAVYLQIRPTLEAARALPRLFAEVPQGSVLSVLTGEEAELGGVIPMHLPLIQLTRGDYFFPGVFPNYFVDYRPRLSFTPDQNLLEVEKAPPHKVICSGLTHIMTLGKFDRNTIVPTQFLHSELGLTMLKIHRTDAQKAICAARTF